MTTRRALRCLALSLSSLAFALGGFAGCGGGDDSTPGLDSGVDAARDATTVTDSGGCPVLETACGASCVNEQSDPNNCGACGIVCGTGTDCESGACVAPCLSGQTRCSGRCVAFETDNANCGSCGTSCGTGLVCSEGACTVACAPPLTTCLAGGSIDAGTADAGGARESDASADAGDAGDAGDAAAPTVDAAAPEPSRYCARTASDENNCGGCGITCAAGKQCDDGVCSDTCAIGQTLCSNVCRDLSTDLANCGACGNTCPSGQVCSGGVCQASCGLPFTLCGSACANTASDPSHCGSCTTSCSPQNVKAPACSSGACNYVGCQGGYSDCDGTVANGCELATSSDVDNCGGCGVHCSGAHVLANLCTGSTCGYSKCATGFADCDGNAANGCEADLSGQTTCGACTTSCTGGSICQNEACVAPPSTIFTDTGATMTVPRALAYTIASAAPSVIYYTEDGSAPTLQSAKHGVSPLTITEPSSGTSTVLNWISYDGLTSSRVQTRTITENAALASSPTHDWILVENVRLSTSGSPTSTNGPVVIASAGQTISGVLSYQVADNACPGCFNQLTVGIASPVSCVFDGASGPWSGATGTNVTFSVTAPSAPGTYPVRLDFQEQFGCADALAIGAAAFVSGGQIIGEVVVP